MKSIKKKRRAPREETVTEVELRDSKYNRLRLAVALLLLAVGAGFLVYAFTQFLGGDDGWTEIEANSASELGCADDFVLLYELGRGEESAAAEKRALKNVYTDACVELYQLFNVYQEFEGVHNLWYINAHPGEEIEVDAVLYDAFSLVERCENRNIYLAPVYEVYDNLFYCGDDSETVSFDPQQNEELAEFCGQVAEFASDEDSVRVELLGDNTVKLVISPEYQSWLDAESVTQYVDFWWMKNAFIADALADVLIENGYTSGVLSSHDGFVRNLDDSGEEYSLNLYDREGDTVYGAGTLQYSGRLAAVCLRNYPLNRSDDQYYYEFNNGELRTAHLDAADACEKSARNNLLAYSREMGCAEILLATIPFYIADDWDADAPERLLESGIYSIYGEDGTLYYNDESAAITDLYDKGGVSYRAVLQ